MNRFVHGLLAMASSAPAWAADQPSRVSTTAWVIYSSVALAFIVAFTYVIWYQKRQEKREKHRRSGSGSSNPA